MKEAKGQKVVPIAGVDMDTDESYVSERMATFIRNIEHKSSNNSANMVEEGGNELSLTPLIENTLIPLDEYFAPFDKAEFSPVGSFEHEERNHSYLWYQHLNGRHVMLRYNGNSGVIEKVFQGFELNLQKDPRYYINGAGRVVAETIVRANKRTGIMEEVTFIVFTDGYQDQFGFVVEDCIATNGFDAGLFTYFAGFNRKEFIRLGVPSPVGCITASPIARDMTDPEEAGLPNLLNFRAFQWRVRFIDVWGRPSEYGRPSDMFLLVSGSDCLSSSSGLPRSVKLRLPAGNPLVDKIELLFRNDLANGINTDWYLYDTINKYNDCEDKDWWQRTIRESLEYNSDSNTIGYVFSNDHERLPVSREATFRNQNYLPLASSSVVKLNRRIALLNNKRGYERMDCSEVDKFGVLVEPPQQDPCNTAKSYKVAVYGVIASMVEEYMVPIRKAGSRGVFGLADCNNPRPNNAAMYGQYLPEDQEGIIGYMAGTSLFAISKQYLYDVLSGDEVYVGFNHGNTSVFENTGQQRKIYPVQKWEFNLPPGEYVFRIASHRAGPNDDYAKTSTNLLGIYPFTNAGVTIPYRLEDQQARAFYERVIKVVDRDITIRDEMFVIADCTAVGSNGNCRTNDRSSLVEGYLYEDEKNKRPIERARVEIGFVVISGSIFTQFTDHNGHYFATTLSRRLEAKFYGTKNSVANQYLAKTDETRNTEQGLYKFQELYAYKGVVEYPATDRYTIRGKITLCGSPEVGLPGVLVVLRNGGYAVTNSRGEYSIFAHNYGNTNNPREEDLIVSQRGSCPILACGDGCNYSMPHIQTISPAFGPENRIFEAGSLSVRLRNVNQYGPQQGGRYGIAMAWEDDLGRETFLEMKDDKHYIDIPTPQQTGSFLYSRIRYNLQFVEFPPEARYVNFYASENLAFDDFLTWAADRVQFIDNTGKTNEVSPTSIRIYYEGLAEYNKLKNLSTNTTWQFISQDDNNPVMGDVIEFIAKGDGTFFPPGLTALVQYDKEGKYLQVDFSEALREVGENTLFKIMRPLRKLDKRFYYSVCKQVKIENRKAVEPFGYINIVDSYLQSRQIPVPVEVIKTTTDNNGNEIETKSFENQARTYPFPFEHHSPSDTWGDHVSNKGRVNVVNPYARTLFKRSEISPSSAISSDGYFNFIHYFREEDSVQLDEQEWGGITAAVSEVNTMLVVCEHDNLVLGFDDNRITVNAEGQVMVRSSASGIGRPDRKIGSNFGCQPWEVNTISKANGLVYYVDANKRALVVHNFSVATDISEKNISGWFASMLSELKKTRTPGNRPMYLHGIVDPKRDRYLLTKAYLDPQGVSDNINNLPFASTSFPETLSVTLEAEQPPMLQFVSFAPQYYAILRGDFRDEQLFSLIPGEMWSHYDVTAKNQQANKFFGVQCDPYLEVVYNADPGREKLWLYQEVVCPELLWYADRIETSAGQISRIMPRWFNRFERRWAADFKCAINTPSDVNLPQATGQLVLLDGEQLHGRWVKVMYTVRDKDRSRYFELMMVAGYYAL